MSGPVATMPSSGAALGSDRWPFGLALVLIALPNLVFLATHLESGPVAVLCVGAVLAALAFVLRDLARDAEPLDRRLVAAALAGALALCLLGGETHLFFANDDWLIRDAVLRDLVAEPWPVGYRYKGDDTLLRAPLGMYLTPALVGKILGLRAAHGALLVQNTLLFGGLFYGFARTVRPLRRSLAVLAVFLLLSGWDVLGRMLLGRPLSFGSHLEQWVSDLQFSAHVTQLFWVPNHAASGWAFVGAYLLRQRGALDTSSLIVVFGLCVFWSPLSMMGALPFLILAVLTERWSMLARPRAVTAVALAGLGLIPVALYLKADAARVAHGWRDLDPVFVVGYGLFLLLELLPFVAILLVGRGFGIDAVYRDGRSPGHSEATARWTLPLALGLLLVVPLYQLGSTDFVMRASIPALALLALRVGAVAVSAAGARRAVVVLVLALGAVTPLYEIGRALSRRAFAISDCSLLQAAGRPPNDGPLYHYVARLDVLRDSLAGRVLALPGTFLAPGPPRSCWPDHDRMGAPTAAAD
ncbi:hypothetical protein [Methylobacterium sp. J-068]|uniref:hypothetical protein n=1 Tax=Methylobacterium sp. J-068 TaxID=2836649 RepID=UPI001FBAC40A|nr:hypothetical protein [Methylobacterium sp. J-068]MCJ2037278.1 hypothetical protein [Methylobacterium sp. J-068]